MTSQNVDAEELAKFAALATHWWDVNGELRTLHQINPLRLGYIESITELSGKRIIDIGCGGGILSESMALKGADVTGIDMNKSLTDVAKLHLHESKTSVEYLCIPADVMADERPQTYDIVTCLEMLEHVPDPAAIVQACARLLKPGGHVFFSTLNRHPKSWLFAILGAEYILNMLPKNTHDYAKFIRPSELSQWIRDVNMTPAGSKGISYHPLSKQFSLSDDISVNYLFHARRPA